MKRIFILLLMVLLILTYSNSAFSVGEGNIDGGGGGMGSGTGSNYWNPGDDGVRITVIRSADNVAVTGSVDFTNITPKVNAIHFGKHSKINYRDGKTLSIQIGDYLFCNPVISLPKIISSSSATANITEIKRYFCSERVIMIIAEETGFDYETLINGNYKILIEPIAYFVYDGNYYAMAAHEAALYDQSVSGRLRANMISLTHKNLPFAMFLERSDLGYPAWTGPTTSSVSNATIISSLGLGIVKFTENGAGESEPDFDYTYRTDTDVITSVSVNASAEYNPDNPLTVMFTVCGTTYTVVNIVIPQQETQLVWFKWHTPSMPQICTIRVNVGGHIRTITANIIGLTENEPPDPKAGDRNDAYTRTPLPAISQTPSATWGAWSAAWHAYWVWEPDWRWTGRRWVDRGSWQDRGWWDFTWNRYQASISASKNILPDSRVPTATGKRMKSGYGFNTNITSAVSTNAPGNAVTQAQTALMYFPEFNYQTYWRMLERIMLSGQSVFEFKRNCYSTYNSRSHFTPVWYPDGSYTPYTRLYDAWTPAGMLSVNLTDSITISGNLFSDWHAAPK